MSQFFALVNQDGMVEQVIVADQAFIDARPMKGKRWVETARDGSKGKNYAGPGHRYDDAIGAFVAPQPFASWSLDAKTAKWMPPVPMPKDGLDHVWNEKTKSWAVLDRSKDDLKFVQPVEAVPIEAKPVEETE